MDIAGMRAERREDGVYVDGERVFGVEDSPTPPPPDFASTRDDVAKLERPRRLSWPFPCPECDAGFDTGTALQLHVKAKHSPLERCDDCGQEFKSKAGLAIHRTRVHGGGSPKKRSKRGLPVKHADIPAETGAAPHADEEQVPVSPTRFFLPLKLDPEVESMAVSYNALVPLDAEQQNRVIWWLQARLGLVEENEE